MNRIIDIDVKFPNETMTLLEDISKVYPIGLPLQNNSFPGYLRIKEIVKDKINSILENSVSKSAKQLRQSVESTFKDFQLFNQYSRQFPNYSIAIEIHNRQDPYINVSCRLNVKVSLLTNRFTVFYDDISTYNDYKIRNIPIRMRIFGSTNSRIDQGDVFFRELIKITTESFPGYSFISHKTLFTHQIKGGLPYGVDYSLQKDYPPYFFLFDNDLIGENYIVAD